ncbi:MAG: trimethylamine methyltransferase family protein [Pseudomonadota bacterium]
MKNQDHQSQRRRKDRLNAHQDAKTGHARRRVRVERKRREMPSSPAYITRQIPFYEMLDEDALTKLEHQAFWLIENIGVEFREDPIALEIWKKAGAEINDTRVRADRALVRELCAKAPSRFTQHAYNPKKSVEIGGKHQIYAAVFGPPFVSDLKGGRRYGTLDDLERLVKLTYQLDHLHHGGLVICEPCDIPVSKRHLDMLLLHMTKSDKPHLGAITKMERAEDSIAMAKILYGEKDFEQKCVIMGNVNTNSPLMVDRVVSEAARVYCGAGQGLIAAPFILGNFLSSMNLRSGAPTFGMPEPMISNLVIGQLARRLKIPLRCGGSLTSSKLPDAQAASESADSMFSTSLSGAHFILHAAGWLEGGLCTSYEKLVLDADRLGVYAKFLQGLDTSDNGLGKTAYEDVEPAGHFLGSQHTLANYETAYYESALSNHDSFEQWSEQGSWDSAKRAYQRWNKMLEEYQPPNVPQDKIEALNAYVNRRKRELPDMWY